MSTSLRSMPGAGTPAAFESPGPVVPGLPAAVCTSDAVLPLESDQAFTGSRSGVLSPGWENAVRSLHERVAARRR
ncbi:MAG: hypothetical protein OXC01_19720 [Immundisolibacterales bacterium]|nr:hypothetical protein [Immundisolibacterales bacterium]